METQFHADLSSKKILVSSSQVYVVLPICSKTATYKLITYICKSGVTLNEMYVFEAISLLLYVSYHYYQITRSICTRVCL